MIPLNSFDALDSYSHNKNVWLRCRTSSTGEQYLEAKKVTFGMRILHFFGIGWRLGEVVQFFKNKEVPADVFQKLKNSVEHHNSRALLRKKIDFQLVASTLNFDNLPVEEAGWIRTFTEPFAGFEEQLKRVQKALPRQPKDIRQIVKRYQQLTQVAIETAPITPAELLRLAIHIEKTVPKVTAAFTKATKTNPRDVLFLQNKKIVVLADRTTSVIKAEGSFKKVFSAAVVPAKRKEAVTEAVQAQLPATPSNKRELELAKELGSLPGFVGVHGYSTIDGKQYSVVFDKFENTLLHLPKTTFEQKVAIAEQVIGAVATMHAKGLVHLDMKMENVLYKGKEFITGLTDFGTTVKTTGTIDLSDNPVETEGSYGTTFATAPELIANKKFAATRTSLEKLDCWACGMLLHELFYGKSPSWFSLVNIDSEKLTKETRNEVIALIERDIEKPLEALLKIKNPNPEQRIKIAIFQMLRLDPANREFYAV